MWELGSAWLRLMLDKGTKLSIDKACKLQANSAQALLSKVMLLELCPPHYYLASIFC